MTEGRSVQIVSQNSFWRDLVPFYSIDMTLFGIAVVTASFAFMMWVDPESSLLVTLGGLLGMSLVNWSVKPSYILIERREKPTLVSALEAIHYRYIPVRDHWVPPIPRWMRWKFNFVKFCSNDGTFKVMGPANILKYLAQQLV